MSEPIWSITGWQNDEAPHWSIAYYEAATAGDAMDALERDLGTDEYRRPDTVWGVTPRIEWKAREVTRPFSFLLGGGCR